MSANTEALANQDGDGGSGEFHSRRPADEPMTTKGHAPGVLVGKDKIPEFEAETLPAGTAPASRTFKPQNDLEVPPVGMDQGDELEQATAPTIAGTTSADVHTRLGHPGSGSSKEIQQDSKKGHQNFSKPLGGVDAATGGFKTADERNPNAPGLTGQDKYQAETADGSKLGAEDKVPETAETVAAERNLPRDQRVYGDK